jgi:hypothetical protein
MKQKNGTFTKNISLKIFPDMDMHYSDLFKRTDNNSSLEFTPWQLLGQISQLEKYFLLENRYDQITEFMVQQKSYSDPTEKLSRLYQLLSSKRFFEEIRQKIKVKQIITANTIVLWTQEFLRLDFFRIVKSSALLVNEHRYKQARKIHSKPKKLEKVVLSFHDQLFAIEQNETSVGTRIEQSFLSKRNYKKVEIAK